MTFNKLTQEEIDFTKSIYLNKKLSWDERMGKLVKFFGKSERTIMNWCSKLGLTERPGSEPEQYIEAKSRIFNKNKKRFIITWGQSNTPVHKKFLKNIEAYAKHIKADIHVIAGRYKNPTSLTQNLHESEEVWDDSIVKYLDANRHDIHKYVSILSDVKIQPTAVNPMNGMQALSGVNSCIFGSPKVQMEVIPVLDVNLPKMMLTTGAITENNYTDSKSGKIGQFHHTFGFCIVEIKDDEIFYVRQVTADDKTGSFSDLYFNVTNGKVTRQNTISAIVLGDIHYGNHDQEVIDSTLKMLDKLKPKHVVLHDVFDGSSISHHEMKDPFLQYGKEIHGKNDLSKELSLMIDGLKSFEKFENVVIVRSNHDDFLDRWLKNEDWKKQPTLKNSRLYMKLSDVLLEQYAENPRKIKGVIPTLINRRYPNYITLDRNSSYKVKDWELSQHGDSGISGSRGSLQQFRKLNTKIVVGHYHTPGRKDGALSVGTSTKLRVGYNIGPSSWLQSHVIIHNDGRVQHITFVKNKDSKSEFTTFK